MTELTNALNRILAWLEEHRPKATEGFQPGLSSAEIEEKLSSLPFCVPEEVCELYRWRNGDELYGMIFGYLWFLDLDKACEYSDYFDGELSVEMQEQQPESIFLFPLFDFDGEYFAIEGSNTKKTTGRIFHISDCFDVSFAFINLTSMMLSIAECYETGVYAITEEDRLEVVDPIEFGRIRHKYNPGTVEALYVEGW